MIAFRKAYVESYPDAEPDAFAALGYDAARLLMDVYRASCKVMILTTYAGLWQRFDSSTESPARSVTPTAAAFRRNP